LWLWLWLVWLVHVFNAILIMAGMEASIQQHMNDGSPVISRNTWSMYAR